MEPKLGTTPNAPAKVDAPPTPGTPPAVEPPKPLSFADLEARDARINGQFEELNRNLTSLATAMASSRQPATATPVTTADVSDQELSDAIANGNPSAIRKLVQNAEERSARRVIEALAPAIQNLQNLGTSAIGDLSKRVMKGEIPYYDMLEGEINKELAKLDPAISMRPEAVANVGHLVAGRNLKKIVDSVVEAKLRELRGTPEGNLDGKTSERDIEEKSRSEVTKRFEEFVGADAMKALKGKGLSPDQYVTRLGYKAKDDKSAVEVYLDQAEGDIQ